MYKSFKCIKLQNFEDVDLIFYNLAFLSHDIDIVVLILKTYIT